MKKFNLLLLILLLSVCCFVYSNYTVAKTENNTIVVPDDFPSIQDAINGATEGDTILVRTGYYFESVFINKSLSLFAEDNETFIVGHNYQLNGTIVLIHHDNVNMTGFTIRANQRTSSRRGIHLLHVSNCNVSYNTITNCGTGIWVYGSSQNIVTGNNLTENIYGICNNLSDSNTFVGNVALGGSYGIQLISSTNNTFRNNNMTDNSSGFKLSSSEPPIFFNYVDDSNIVDGKPICYWINRSYETVPSNVEYVIIVNCTGITVQDPNRNYKEILLAFTNNSIIRNTEVPIRLVSSFYNTVTHNNGTVKLENSSFNTITENVIKYMNRMVHLTGSSGNIISENMIAQGNGVLIEQSSNDNMIFNNTITSNHQGIHLSGSTNNILKNNNLTDNSKQFFVSSPDSSLSKFVNHVDISNTVNGKPIYYWVNKRDTTVPSDAGYIVLVNCYKMTIEDLNFMDGQGLLLAWTTNSTITRNIISNGQGIHLVYASTGNTVSENIVESNDYGITVSHCHDNLLVGNNITYNTFRGINLQDCQSISVIGNIIRFNNVNGIGLLENATKNIISQNQIEHNRIGIYIQDSSENLIVANTILKSEEWGIQLKGKQNSNNIYHNFFIDNRKWKDDGLQVSIPGMDEKGVWVDGYTNVWDDGEMGNYWSDYHTRYTNATEIDDSGIGDTPFLINPNNTDNHPIMDADLIPELPSWTILPLLIVASLGVLVVRNRLSKNGLE